MLMLITPSEDGPYITFHESMDAMMQRMDWAENPETMPKRWLSLEEVQKQPDTMYWDEGSVFLADVTPMKLAPKEKVITHELVRQ